MARRGQIRLSSSSTSASLWARSRATATKLAQARSFQAVTKVVFASWRVEGTPLRVRPILILTTGCTLLLLSLLGFHPTLAQRLQHPAVPFSDKILHFVGFFLASVQFYSIWLVNERARVEGSVVWRWWVEGISWGTCGFVGSVLSEFVQSLLPYKSFQLGDIIANLLGTTLGLTLARRATIHYRRVREVRRLYAPLGSGGSVIMGELGGDSDDGEEEDTAENYDGREAGAREMEEGRSRAEERLVKTPSAPRGRADSNPWDDTDADTFGGSEADVGASGSKTMFDIGDESEGDEAGSSKRR